MSTHTKNLLTRCLLALSVTIFGVIIFFGYQGPGWIKDSLCFTYLGCNAGFFGYDSIMHFSSGFMDVMIFIWLCRTFPRTNVFGKSFRKNAFIIICVVAFAAVAWEILEFCHDYERIRFFHENLMGEDRMDQPSNADTMGDITLTLVGAFLTVTLPRFFKANIFNLLD